MNRAILLSLSWLMQFIAVTIVIVVLVLKLMTQTTVKRTHIALGISLICSAVSWILMFV